MKRHAAITEPRWIRYLLIGISILFLISFLITPLILIFVKAFEGGIGLYLKAFVEPEALAAMRLTALVVCIAVPLNTIFGLCASWAITKFEFRGKGFLLTLIDLPFTVSPVISGLIFVLLFSDKSWLGGIFYNLGIQIIFSTPGIVMVTTFVTFPFVARELIPLMQSQGIEEEEAALTLGATGWQTFWRVSLPNIKWGLMYGIILCTARAVGEFGAVSVVSGHIRGLTNTMPLHIEILYNEYNFTAAFAVSSLMVFGALVTLLIKHYIEWRMKGEKRL